MSAICPSLALMAGRQGKLLVSAYSPNLYLDKFLFYFILFYFWYDYRNFIGKGVWDPNSWGQFLGGTATKRGRDKGFSDASHVAGQAIRTSLCRPHMLCIPKADQMKFYEFHNFKASSDSAAAGDKGGCILAPHVRCGSLAEVSSSNVSYLAQGDWAPLWNLHVHSKHTQDFMSRPCNC